MNLLSLALIVSLALAQTAPALADDDSPVKEATREIENGAKDVRQGNVSEGAREAAAGVGRAIAEGARYAGERLKESGRAAEPATRSGWKHAKESAHDFGRALTAFCSELFKRRA